MSNTEKTKMYTLGEEIFSSVSHGIGVLLGVAATVALCVVAALNSDTWGIVGSAVYGATLIILYAMSTLYHSVTTPRAKRVFRVIDHCSIFLLIAGTYTPIMLCTMRTQAGAAWALSLLCVQWTTAIVGIILNAIDLHRFSKLSMVLYVMLGWSALARWDVLWAMSLPAKSLLLGGGIVYMLGLIFYALKKRYAHAIWHLFVLGGSILHFFFILLYVVQ
ncbi:MAG: hemolysin III family protein [Clostridia bacterium]|nr:hemolysin III family protein [Clostridia bacterium]